MNQED